jgi:putative salt-induced outer membrane protein YdiY
MTFRRPCRKLIFRALALALFICGGGVRAQNVTVHLRNGDRITGLILADTTNQLTLSNVWSREIVIPQSQITQREILPTLATNAPVAATPKLKPATNAPVKTMPPNYISIVMVPDPPNTNFMVWLKRWKGEASVGTDLERGAVDHQLYYGRAKLTYSQAYESDPKQFFRNILTYDLEYGKTDGTVSDNRMTGSSKTDFDLTQKIYVYNLGLVSHDVVNLINIHYEDGPGAGYHWINKTNLTLNLELGANYQVEKRLDNTRTESAYFRLAQDMGWKLNKQVNFTEKIEFFPRVDYVTQFRGRFESNLSYALSLWLSLNFTVIDQYDTRPALTVPNNDLQLRTSLGVKF